MTSRFLLSALVVAQAAVSVQAESGTELVDLALPFVGTDNTREVSHGNLYPCISRPWGMHAWTPQTRSAGQGWLYDWKDQKFLGLHQTHQPSPWIGDYGQFTVMATTGDVRFSEEERACWFSHKTELATPAQYKVYLAEYDTWMEVAPTDRAAMIRVTYPKADSPRFVFDALDGDAEVNVDRERGRIFGYTSRRFVRWNESAENRTKFRNWFVIQSDRPFTEVHLESGERKGAVVTFAPTKKNEQVSFRVASSFIDLGQAERNLQELGNGDFDSVLQEGRRVWNENLGRISVTGGSADERRMFYTCLYRSLLLPRKLHELDAGGRPVHQSPYGKGVCPGVYYADTGYWDAFRALCPLLNLVYPETGRDIIAGMDACLAESGWLPEWASPDHRACMIGQNAASIVADAMDAGLVDRPVLERLYAGLVAGANGLHPTVATLARPGWEEYNALGYVPRDGSVKNQSASRTLEYAYDDYCISRVAEKLNRPDEEISLYCRRGGNWRNVIDPARGLAVGRNRDGSFEKDFDSVRWGYDFTEGNSLHYTWSVFHDIEGLIAAMGGKASFRKRLDSLFTMPPVFDGSFFGGCTHEIREMQVAGFGQYAHGNEPVHHVIYLYDWLGDRATTAQLTERVMRGLYVPRPDGFCGDEDTGQLSAWYVWSAMGLYPVCPAKGEYALGRPLFDRVGVRLGNRELAIVWSETVSCPRWKGRELSVPFIRRADLKSGGELEL